MEGGVPLLVFGETLADLLEHPASGKQRALFPVLIVDHLHLHHLNIALAATPLEHVKDCHKPASVGENNLDVDN